MTHHLMHTHTMTRHTITSDQFPAILAKPCGGDLWNPRTILHRILAIAPDATRYSYDRLTTGLWADVTITTPARTIERRIFG